MDDYNSKFTGPEIDAAIDRAKAGGAIDTLLAGKAPAGYGLGGVATWLDSTDDLNNIKKTGWYRWFDRPIHAPGEFGAMTVVVTAPDGRLVQEVVFVLPKFNGTSNFTVNCKVRRVCYENTWQPWEWVNPPMKLDAEYRTTERYLGKPVYVLTKPSKTLGAAGSTVYIEGLPGDIEDVIDYRLKIKSSGGSVAMNNYFNSNGSAQCVSSVQVTTDHYAWGYIKCISDCTSLTATCTFKYIKTTD